MRVKNKGIGLIYNMFDMPIRWIYCRMSWMSKLFFWKMYSSDFERLDKEFHSMQEMIDYDFNNKICLEVGPGNSYMIAYNMLVYGASNVWLVDKFPRISNTNKQKERFAEEIRYIWEGHGINLNNDNITFAGDEIRKVKGLVDFIVSIDVLEHVNRDEVEGMIHQMYDVIKKNGIMFHRIDMRDHYNFNKPFLFHKYKEDTWNKLTRENVSYTNRLGYLEYMQMFINAGFELVDEKLEIVKDGGKEGVGVANLFLRKK